MKRPTERSDNFSSRDPNRKLKGVFVCFRTGVAKEEISKARVDYLCESIGGFVSNGCFGDIRVEEQFR